MGHSMGTFSLKSSPHFVSLGQQYHCCSGAVRRIAWGDRFRAGRAGTVRIDDAQFIELVKAKNISRSEGLRQLTPDDLPPCYTVVLVPYANAFPEPKLHRWHMPEDGMGQLIEPGSGPCT